jgi:hypothetical protein
VWPTLRKGPESLEKIDPRFPFSELLGPDLSPIRCFLAETGMAATHHAGF